MNYHEVGPGSDSDEDDVRFFKHIYVQDLVLNDHAQYREHGCEHEAQRFSQLM